MKQHFVSALLLGTVVIGSPALAQSQSDLEDGTIVVNGQRPRNEASAGTKSAVPIAETPQSISVISAADIADLGLQNLNQALRFVAGATTEQQIGRAHV